VTIPNTDMPGYYAARAQEYDRIYDKPERQKDLAELKTLVSQAFAGQDVLEIACGTGYWTQFIAKTAARIYSTDINQEVLVEARKRNYQLCWTNFAIADVYSLNNISAHYSAGFAGFLWSHIPLSRQSELIRTFHSRLQPGAKVIWIDGRYVEGSSTPINRKDEAGNTYQLRKLTDGSLHEVMKNYPDEADLQASFSAYADNLEVKLLQYFWVVSYKVK
jgi:SAM-dependent methyltransferase